jgi:hypothetical protein
VRLQSILDQIETIEETIANTPTTWMCTSTCPCPVPTNQTWYSKYTNAAPYTYQGKNYSAEAWANTFNRTLALVANPLKPSLVPFKVVNGTGSTAYDNFWDCYQYLSGIDKQLAQVNSSYQPQVQSVSASMKNFAQSVESSLNCNGICYPGLFYYFKTVYSGPPTQNCIAGLTAIMGNNPLGIGILLLVSFLLTIFVHIASWSMCCRCCAAKDTKDDKWERPEDDGK